MATVDPKYRINWAVEGQYWKPGALADLARVANARHRAKARHPAAKAHAHLSNRLAAAAHQDVWRHKGEIAGQR